MPAPPPPPPPLPPASKSRPSASTAGSPDDRGALLASIRAGCRLKSVQTNDCSTSSAGVGRIVSSSQCCRPSSAATASSRASFLHVPATGKTTTLPLTTVPSVEENTNYSLPGSPQPMVRRVTSRTSISSMSSSRRPAPAVPGAQSLLCGAGAVSSSALSRGGVGRRSRVCTKPTAPPPPPPVSVSPSLSTASTDSTVSTVFSRLQPSVVRAHSMRSPADAPALSSSYSPARATGTSRPAQEPVLSSSTVLRSAPPLPSSSSPSTYRRRLSQPLKPAPPPPPALHHRTSVSSLGGVRPPDIRPPVVCVQTCQPPPLPVRNSSLSSTSITSSSPRASLTADSRMTAAVTTSRRQSQTPDSSADDSNNVFINRYLTYFSPVSSLPAPPRFSHCTKLYPSRRNTVRRARAPPPPPLLTPVVGSNLVR